MSEEKPLRIHFASGRNFGKAMESARHIAKMAKDYSHVEIYVYPAPEMKELQELRNRSLTPEERAYVAAAVSFYIDGSILDDHELKVIDSIASKIG